MRKLVSIGSLLTLLISYILAEAFQKDETTFFLPQFPKTDTHETSLTISIRFETEQLRVAQLRDLDESLKNLRHILNRELEKIIEQHPEAKIKGQIELITPVQPKQKEVQK